MITLSQTYSKSVNVNQIHEFFQTRRIADKITVKQNATNWYIFSSEYFSENQLHDILDDLFDIILEAAE